MKAKQEKESLLEPSLKDSELRYRRLFEAAQDGILLPLGVIMLDVDGLKRCNDTWGHAAGDAVLRELGSVLLGHFRGEDVSCRYGGDEFVIILPDASLKVTYERAQRICEHAIQFQHTFEGKTLDAVTLSIGVAVFPEHGSSNAAILRAADNALYHAKHEGRAQVVVAG